MRAAWAAGRATAGEAHDVSRAHQLDVVDGLRPLPEVRQLQQRAAPARERLRERGAPGVSAARSSLVSTLQRAWRPARTPQRRARDASAKPASTMPRGRSQSAAPASAGRGNGRSARAGTLGVARGCAAASRVKHAQQRGTTCSMRAPPCRRELGQRSGAQGGTSAKRACASLGLAVQSASACSRACSKKTRRSSSSRGSCSIALDGESKLSQPVAGTVSGGAYLAERGPVLRCTRVGCDGAPLASCGAAAAGGAAGRRRCDGVRSGRLAQRCRLQGVHLDRRGAFRRLLQRSVAAMRRDLRGAGDVA